MGGKHLLVYQEMGHGDAIMMMRYLPTVMEHAAVTVAVADPLHRLVENQFAVSVLKEGDPIAKEFYDYRVPFFGLMPALRQDVETIPPPPFIDMPEPYPLPRTSKTRIGIAWSGRPSHTRDRVRSIPLDRFLGLLDHEDCELYALQTDVDQVATLGVNVVPIDDFYTVAQLIAAMDHVVCVDTAAAHLAGALAHPSAHVLLHFAPDWRWYKGSAWYPDLNVYRQPEVGDWRLPFDQLNRALRPVRRGRLLRMVGY